MKTSLMWFRRDLRLHDNPALTAALDGFSKTILCFTLDPAILKARETGAPRIRFFLQTLQALESEIEKRGGHLTLIEGAPDQVLPDLASAHAVDALFWNRDYEPYAIRRDAAMARVCKEKDIAVHTFHDQCLHPPGEVRKSDGDPYVVFTPFFRQWQKQSIPDPLPAPTSLQKTVPADGVPLPDASQWADQDEIQLPPAGEAAAQQQLDHFLENGLMDYHQERDNPSVEGTSRLSPHLRFGSLSARTVWKNLAPRRGKGRDIFLSELAWRDFYKQILHFFPHVEKGAYRREYDAIQWPNQKQWFHAWCAGQTGFPIVDAGMRQLNQSGWMHNRLRMIVASFLTKDLQIDWRWGERYFMQRLLDGDLAANNGGWQWAAGTGTDAAPYFRIFNPTRQAERFDPGGHYIERWVPEVESRDYPDPIVDHKAQRESTLKLYKQALG